MVGRFKRRRRTFRRRTVRRKPHVEFKCTDVNISGVVTTAGIFVLLNPVGQGVGDEEHLGSTYWNKSVQLQFCIARDLAATQPADTIQLGLLYDKDPDNIQPVTTAYLEALGPFAFRNLNNRDRWVILKKTFLSLDKEKQSRTFKWYKRFALRTVTSSTLSTVAGIRSGALWFFMISDNAVDPPIINGLVRGRFTDA